LIAARVSDGDAQDQIHVRGLKGERIQTRHVGDEKSPAREGEAKIADLEDRPINESPSIDSKSWFSLDEFAQILIRSVPDQDS
jgi:hypothetical protein